MGGEEDTDLTPRIVNANRRANLIWLVSAIAAFTFSVAVTFMARWGTQEIDRATSAGIDNEAVRIATAIDASARAAHLQADGLATSPMVRAAITTDAATVIDLFQTEVKFAPKTGEILELFQLRDKQAPVSLIRLPHTAAALVAPKGRATRLENTGKGGLDVIAGAPVAAVEDQAGMSGEIALSVPVELGGARQRLAELVGEATLVGAGKPVVLVEGGEAAGDAVRVDVAPNTEWGIASLSLEIKAGRSHSRAGWIDPVRYGSLAFGVVLMGMFLLGLRRR